jgi:hypothetical protein
LSIRRNPKILLFFRIEPIATVAHVETASCDKGSLVSAPWQYVEEVKRPGVTFRSGDTEEDSNNNAAQSLIRTGGDVRVRCIRHIGSWRKGLKRVESGTHSILQASDRFRAVSGTQSGVNLAGAKFSYRPFSEPVERRELG